jgi:hypothetical protein
MQDDPFFCALVTIELTPLVVTILWLLTGAIACTQCKGGGENLEDHFGGRFKAGGLCWLCR